MLKSVLLLLTLVFPQPVDIDGEALEWFRRGEAMIGTEQEYSEAQAECFREALSRSPGFKEARHNLVLVLLAREAYGEAESEASLLIENGSAQGYLLRAEARLMQGRVGPSLEDLEVFLSRNPGDAGAWELQGEAFFRDAAYTDAAGSYRKAMDLGRDGMGIRINLGLALLNSGENQEAADWFSGFSEEFPGSWEGYYWRGIALKALGRMEEAASALVKAEEINPDDDGIRDELTEVFLALGELREAGSRINRKRIKTAADYANLALLAKAEGRLEDALAFFRAAAEKDPEDASLPARIGDIQLDLGQEEEAADSYRRALAMNPVDFPTLVNLGQLLFDREELPEARSLLERAVSLEPGSADARFRLAMVLDRTDNPVPAREAYEKSLELGGESLVAHFRLGFLLAEEGDAAGAMEHLEAAVAGDPERFIPHLIRELRRVKSPLDSIRYTAPFSELINRHREYWVVEEEGQNPKSQAPNLRED